MLIYVLLCDILKINFKVYIILDVYIIYINIIRITYVIHIFMRAQNNVDSINLKFKILKIVFIHWRYIYLSNIIVIYLK